MGVLEVLGSIEGCFAIVISISRVSTSGQQSTHTLQVAHVGGYEKLLISTLFTPVFKEEILYL